MSIAVDSVKSDRLKEDGNRCFQKNDFDGAIAFYSQAIELNPANFLLYTNRSLCYLKLELWREACLDALKCIELNPENPKGYYCLGCAKQGLQELEDAIAAFEKVVSFSSTNNPSNRNRLSDLRRRLRTMKDSAGMEVLNACLAGRWNDVAETLKKCGRRINLELRGSPEWAFTRTPLLLAVARGPPEIVTLLLHNGANPRATCNENRCAVGWAVYGKRLKCLAALLNFGVSLSQNKDLFFDCFGESAESWNYGECEFDELFRFLLANGADPNACRPARSKGLFGGSSFMEDHPGFSIAPCANDPSDPPIFKVLGDRKLVQLLLDYGADPNVWSDERTPLMQVLWHLSCSPKDENVLSTALLLIQRGARVTGTMLIDGKWTKNFFRKIESSTKARLLREEKWYRRRHWILFLSAYGKRATTSDGIREKVLLDRDLQRTITSFL